MKGQYLTVEYVLFFAFGVTMAVGVFLLFSNIAGNIRESGMEAQFEKTGELIRGHIIQAFNSAKFTGSTVKYNVSIPTELSDCIYLVNIDGNNLELRCKDNFNIGAVLSLYGITAENEAVVYSSRGLVKITAEPDGVTLG